MATINILIQRYLVFCGHEWKLVYQIMETLRRIIDIILEFDPFMHEHPEKYKNEKNVTYLPKNVYEK